MIIDITIPEAGESITEGFLASWSVSDGDFVVEGQVLLEFETDKTTLDVSAPASGRISITTEAGVDVQVSQVVAKIDTEAQGENKQITPAEKAPKATSPPSKSTTPPVQKDDEAIPRSTPSARQEGERHNVNLNQIQGSERGGMRTKSDVLESVKSSSPLSTSPPQNHEARREPLSRIRRAIASNLKRTKEELVLLTTFNEVDMSAAKALRSRHGEAFLQRHGVKLGYMGLFLKAVAHSMEQYPQINAHIEGEDAVYPDGIHISVAVSTPKGLVTPVIRHVQSLSIAQIEQTIRHYAEKAMGKSLLPQDMEGGSFTVTNGGVFGSMMSTPLPSPGQSAILGMHAILDRPIAHDGQVEIHPMMYVALSYDHRLVDGREAVGFLKGIKEAIEDPQRLLLEV